MSSAATHRALPVPEGLSGERLDAAMARLFGLSRTRAAELIEAGQVRLDGRHPAKSARVSSGGWLEVDLPGVAPPAAEADGALEGLRILAEDDDDDRDGDSGEQHGVLSPEREGRPGVASEAQRQQAAGQWHRLLQRLHGHGLGRDVEQIDQQRPEGKQPDPARGRCPVEG